MVTNTPYQIGGNVLNSGLIDNLPTDACVEVPCLVDGRGVNPTHVGRLPVQCAAMNMTNINVQLLTIEAAKTKKLEHIYQAAMLDPHTAAELAGEWDHPYSRQQAAFPLEWVGVSKFFPYVSKIDNGYGDRNLVAVNKD